MARFVTLLLLFTLAAWATATAQTATGTLVGAVRDAQNVPAAFAALKLFRTTDSTLVTGTVATDAGAFTLRNVPVGTYRVQASLVGTLGGSQLATVKAGKTTYLEPILLRADDAALATVTVRARKPYVEQQTDKTVLNVAANDAAQSRTAYELLQQAPGVVIDPNDNIRMAGTQGVLVYIDGKPSNLSGNDLANLLRATPASNIATVELIQNPSARFDAQGGAGIINIRFRRDKSLGLNGNASGGYGQSNHHRANAALDLNYRANRINLFGNASVSDNYQHTNLAYNRTATDGNTFTQRGYDYDGTRAVLYKAGADVFFGNNGQGPKHTLGLLVTGNAGANRFGTITTANLGNAARTDSTLLNETNNPSWNRRLNAALNYQFADTLGHDLTLDVDYSRFGNESPSVINTTYLRADATPLFRRRNRFAANTNIDILTLKADFNKEWKQKALKLSAGLKHTDVRTDNDLLAYTGGVGNEAEQADATRTNQFTYREIVSAAYVSLTKTLGKWSLQAGLRAENSTILGRSTDLANRTINRPGVEQPDTAYLNLFPTAYATYQASENSRFSLNYGRRIERPNYQSLNPFIYQIDPYTSERGNPYLRPAYTHKGSLSYTYKWAMTVSLAYSRTDDFATDIIRQEGLIAYSTVANVGRADVLNLSLNTPIQITKWWNSYLYAGATWNRFRGEFPATTTVPAEGFDQRAFAFEGYMQHSFTLSKTMEMQLSGFWNAPTRQTIFQNGGLGAINLSATRKVLHDRGRLTLAADDLFNTMRWRQSGTFDNGAQFNLDRKWESRRISLRFSYRFGSDAIKAARDRETGTDAGRIKVKGN